MELNAPEGHGYLCYHCKKPINGFAGNPCLWPTQLICNTKIEWWHLGCASNQLNKTNSTLNAIYSLCSNKNMKSDEEVIKVIINLTKDALDIKEETV